jgi:hypothetical protein
MYFIFTSFPIWEGIKYVKTLSSNSFDALFAHVTLFIYLFIYFLFKIFKIFIVLLFICAYNAWVISPSCPHPLPYHPLRPLPLLPTPSIPSRNYFALISNFVVERV